MTWRSLQLNGQPCSQDLVIYDLFQNLKVRYAGNDVEFADTLNLDSTSKHLILCVNHPVWLSELWNLIFHELSNNCETFYIGINRYQIKGNDTNFKFDADSNGSLIIAMIKYMSNMLGYTVIKQGSFDNDRGKHLNFVQPLTWVYGTHHPDL